MSNAAAVASNISTFDREGFAAFVLRMRARALDNRALMTAIEAVPRRGFVEPQYHDAVWTSRMIPIDCGEVIEGLDFQAMVFDALDLEENHRVLEIGAGSGYSAAVMGKLVKRVYSVERFHRLQHAAQARIRTLKIDNVVVTHADGSHGSPEGPFDRIVIWPAVEELPREFSDQLVSGGRLICPMGTADERQTLVRLTKVGSRYEREDMTSVRAQMMVAGLPESL